MSYNTDKHNNISTDPVSVFNNSEKIKKTQINLISRLYNYNRSTLYIYLINI